MPNNPEAAASLHPDTFPRDEYPELYEKRPVIRLTEDQINDMHAYSEQLIAEQKARADARRRRSKFAHTDFADNPIYDEAEVTPELIELRRLYGAVASLLTHDLGPHAMENIEGASAALRELLELLTTKLHELGWYPEPMHGQKD